MMGLEFRNYDFADLFFDDDVFTIYKYFVSYEFCHILVSKTPLSIDLINHPVETFNYKGMEFSFVRSGYQTFSPYRLGEEEFVRKNSSGTILGIIPNGAARRWEDYRYGPFQPSRFGFYEYDMNWCEGAGPFHRLNVPDDPIHFRELPEDLREIVCRNVMPEVSFADAPFVQPIEHMACSWPDYLPWLESDGRTLHPPAHPDRAKRWDADWQAYLLDSWARYCERKRQCENFFK